MLILVASSAVVQAQDAVAPQATDPAQSAPTKLPAVEVTTTAPKKTKAKSAKKKPSGQAVSPQPVAGAVPSTSAQASQGLASDLLQASRQATSGVTVFTAADVVRSGESGVFDVIKSTPNLTPAAGGSSLPAIRGEGAGASDLGGTLLYGTSPQIALIVDDIARVTSYSNASFQNLFDVSFVEVLKGPQTALVGTSAFAGAYLVKTNDPVFKFYSEALTEITWNEYTGANYRVAGVANAPLSSEAAMRLVVQYEEGDDPVRYRGGPAGTDLDRLNDFDTLNLRGKLLIKPDSIPGLTLLATGEYQSGLDNAFNSYVSNPAVSGHPYEDRIVVYTTDTRIFDTEAWVGGLTATYALSAREEIKSVTSFVSDHFAVTPYSTGAQIDDVTEHRFAQDLLYSFRGVHNLTGVVGASFVENSRYYEISSPIVLVQDFDISSQAVYADVAWNFAPRLDLLVGGRIEHRTDDRIVSRFGVDNLSSGEDTYVLPKIGLQYHLAREETIAATVRKGYNPGGAFANIYTGAYIQFDDETLWTYEVAYRTKLLRDQLSFGVTAYYNDYTDKQLYYATPPSFFNYDIINVEKAHSYGVEFEVAAAVTRELDVKAGLGLQQTEITEATDPAFEGNEFGGDPTATPSLAVAWRPAPGLELTGKVLYVSGYFSEYLNKAGNRGGDYTLLDLGASYTEGPFVLRAFVNNVTDELAIDREYDAGAHLLPPRTFGTSLKVAF